MADPNFFAFSGIDPPGPEPIIPGDVIASLSPVHRLAGLFGLAVHGVVRGPLRVEEVRCTDGARVCLSPGDPSYLISFPVRGALFAAGGGREVDVGPDRAAVFGPRADAELTTDEDCDVLVVRIDAAALEDALEARLGSPVRRPLPVAPIIDLGTPAGRAWSALAQLVLGAVPGGMLANPVIAEPLQNWLLDGLLRVVDHPYRDALDESPRSWEPRAVRRCVDTFEAFPELPFTVAGLAQDSGVSVRGLEEAWRRQWGARPADYLRGVRLTHAHRDLVEHAPGETSVTATALRWGFAQPAPFAAGYAARYGLPPFQTLRGPAYA